MAASCLRLFPLFLCAFILSCSGKPAGLSLYADKGVMDLSRLSNSGNYAVELNGNWEFYFGKLYAPGVFSDEKKGPQSHPEKVYFSLPNNWNGYFHDGIAAEGPGFATFRLRLVLPASGEYGLRVWEINTSYRLYLNGEKMIECGRVGTNFAESLPSWKRQSCFARLPAGTNEVVLQVANFRHRKGGPEQPLLFGTRPAVLDDMGYRTRVEMFILGILAIMAVYHLVLFFSRQHDRTSLFFSAFCVLVSLRLLCTGEKILLDIFPAIGWELAVKIEYLSFFLGLPVFLSMLNSLFGRPFHRAALLIAHGVTLIYSLLTLATPVLFFSNLLPSFQVFAGAVVLYIILMLFSEIAAKNALAVLVLAGFLVVAAGYFNDILFNFGIIQTGYIFPYALAVFIVIQAGIIARQYSLSFRKVEVLSSDLESRNAELRDWSEKSQKRSRDQIAMLLTALEQSGDSVVITDTRGNIEYVNRKFLEVTGYTMEDVVGQNPRILKSGEMPREKYDELWRTISEGKEWRGEFHNRRKDGTLYWEDASITPVRGGDGSVTHFIAVKEDISDRKRIETELANERKELRIRNEVMETQFRMARRVQDSLLPDSPPWDSVAVFYHPMERIGGDFYDFLLFRDPDMLGIVIADVSGHGVPAALVTSMLKSLLTQAGHLRNDPPGLLYYLNAELGAHPTGQFVTAQYGVFDRKSGVFRYASAGHNPPYIIREGKMDTPGTRVTGVPLSLFTNDELETMGKKYRQGEITLGAGEKLLIYTDGLVEAMPSETVRNGSDDGEFGEARLAGAVERYWRLPAPAFLSGLASDLEEFHGGHDYDDDVCVICIER